MGKERGREGRQDAGRGVSALDQWLRQFLAFFCFCFGLDAVWGVYVKCVLICFFVVVLWVYV